MTRWIVALVIAAVSVGIVWVLTGDATTPVAAEVLVFEGEAGTDSGDPGIYRYATDGFEEIDALQGARHTFPSETYMTITASPCGPLVRWDALAERWIEWEHCGADLAITRTVEYHEWFGVPDTEEEVCRLHRSVSAAADLTCRAIDSTEAYAVEVIGSESISVGSEVLDTLHIRRVSSLIEGSAGSTVADVWRLVGTPLVVRAEWESTSVTPSPAGDVTYTEQVTLRLLDARPAPSVASPADE